MSGVQHFNASGVQHILFATEGPQSFHSSFNHYGLFVLSNDKSKLYKFIILKHYLTFSVDQSSDKVYWHINEV